MVPITDKKENNSNLTKHFFWRQDDKAFIERSLVDSERVQMEDITLCEGVQRGMESPTYCSGRYAPTVEKAMYHFHCLLYDNLID
ncbi:Uncharacterized protein TCM_039639 [Theobroma cacao]|uniref:Choline monooxygenase, chloroplastic n=1 Tax=Theobroma cacao TaxID=3641 RepID=A0A061GYB5_THECC|nr:Uncharacterized protein TCM_039639 [Theobroma cacao]